ncbi:MAG: hypothetical protein IFK94_10935 [Acidobacteria bacterium]|uniref:Esterase n=1 Tax=Candidatus Polarisedimenticola svalbardensis TaxID=2886004 RepID=A0A8J6XVD5_9BACT|nr:hypothetical protein [Candidatus Polarisedimenticola svalbardensis]
MKHPAFSVFLVLGLVLVGTMSISAAAPEPMQYAERITIHSDVMDEDRVILISKPAGYDTTTAGYPVLYMTDGGAHLLHTAGTVDFLNRNGRIPQVIIVGVLNTDRTRDLTPTAATITQQDGNEVEFPTSGGADRFLKFISSELMPYVESNYRTVPFRIFAGHSFGGLLSAYTLVSQPDLFNAYIAASPTLGWDDDLILKKAKKLFTDRKELNKTFYMTLGDEPPLQGSYDTFEKFLKKTHAKGFTWGSKQMPAEDHGSVVLRSHYFGLKKIFEDWQIPRDAESGVITGGLEGVKAHFGQLSKKYGYAVTPPEGQINVFGYQALGNGKHAEAIEIFRYNVKLSPLSANPHDSLGEALEADGQLEAARESYARAFEIGGRNKDPNTQVFKTNLDRVTNPGE